jgi:hypothetical protein
VITGFDNGLVHLYGVIWLAGARPWAPIDAAPEMADRNPSLSPGEDANGCLGRAAKYP